MSERSPSAEAMGRFATLFHDYLAWAHRESSPEWRFRLRQSARKDRIKYQGKVRRRYRRLCKTLHGWSPREIGIFHEFGRRCREGADPPAPDDIPRLKEDVYFLLERVSTLGSGRGNPGPEEAWRTPSEAIQIAADAGIKVRFNDLKRAKDRSEFRWRVESAASYDIELTSLKAWLFDRLMAREPGRGS